MFTTVMLANYRGFRHVAVDLAPFTIVYGSNGSGKSTLLSALQHLAMSAKLHAQAAAVGSRLEVSPLFTRERGLSPEFFAEADLSEWYARRVSLSAESAETGALERRLRVFSTLAPTIPAVSARATSISSALLGPTSTVLEEELALSDRELADALQRGRRADVLRNRLVRLGSDSLERVNRELRDLAGAEILTPSPIDGVGAAEPLRVQFRRERATHELASANHAMISLLSLLVDVEQCLAGEGPKILMLDEPELHLQPRLQGEVAVRLVRRARERGAQLVFATHSPDIGKRLLPRSDAMVLAFPAPLTSPRRVADSEGLRRALRGCPVEKWRESAL